MPRGTAAVQSYCMSPTAVTATTGVSPCKHACTSAACPAADWCRSCRRVATHVSMLADNLTATAPEIVVARLDCDKAVNFCNDVIRIEKTPSFKVRCNVQVGTVPAKHASIDCVGWHQQQQKHRRCCHALTQLHSCQGSAAPVTSRLVNFDSL